MKWNSAASSLIFTHRFCHTEDVWNVLLFMFLHIFFCEKTCHLFADDVLVCVTETTLNKVILTADISTFSKRMFLFHCSSQICSITVIYSKNIKSVYFVCRVSWWSYLFWISIVFDKIYFNSNCLWSSYDRGDSMISYDWFKTVLRSDFYVRNRSKRKTQKKLIAVWITEDKIW